MPPIRRRVSRCGSGASPSMWACSSVPAERSSVPGLIRRPSRFGVHADFLLASLLLGLVATPLSVGLQGLDAFGAPLSQLTKPIVWQTGFDTSWGSTATIGLFGVLVSLGAFMTGGEASARALTLLGLCSVGLALAASGHASTASPQLLTQPAVFLHAIGLTLWTGALAPLAAAMRGDKDHGLATLRRFSRSAPAVVAVIVVSGTTLSIVQLGRVSALWSTDYGRVLLAKLGIVAALLAIAGWNCLMLTPRIARGEGASRRQLVRTITAELVLVTFVFALATTWRFTPPPRGLVAAAETPASLHLHTARAAAEVTFTPARAGRVGVSMVIMSANLGPLDAQDVRLTLANPGAGVEPITRPAYKPGDGTWRVDAVTIPLPGLWSVRLDILMPDASTATLEDTMEIPPDAGNARAKFADARTPSRPWRCDRSACGDAGCRALLNSILDSGGTRRGTYPHFGGDQEPRARQPGSKVHSRNARRPARVDFHQRRGRRAASSRL